MFVLGACKNSCMGPKIPSSIHCVYMCVYIYLYVCVFIIRNKISEFISRVLRKSPFTVSNYMLQSNTHYWSFRVTVNKLVSE